MQEYKNFSGNSGVIAYENSDNEIWVKFRIGGKYLYTAEHVGQVNITKMIELAEQGKGLNTYINQNKNVKENYSDKVNE